MLAIRTTLMALLLVAACDGNPLDGGTPPNTGGGAVDPDTGGGITTPGGLPPGTTSPTPASSVTRFEPKGTATVDGDSGNGYVRDVSYDPVADTFKVDNLAFDGNNVFARSTQIGSLGPYAVYDGKPSIPDSFTGSPIDQLDHHAIYGVKNGPDGKPQVQFAIVRTGAYVDYGFGGFVYSRTGGVELPREGVGLGSDPENPAYRGQAHYEGTTAGLRDFLSRGGLEYATGNMTVDIDFDDFNDGNGVKGFVTNRRVYDSNGNDITQTIIDALTEKSGANQTELPVLAFKIGPGVMNDNGEIAGLIGSTYTTDGGNLETFETGKYYALVSGANAGTIVGVLVVQGDDPRFTGVTTRETDGFILERK